MTTIIDAIKMCEEKINIYQNDTKNIEIKIGRKRKEIYQNVN